MNQHEIDRSIPQEIDDMALTICEGEVNDARALISECSEFPGQSGTVSLKSKYGADWVWARVSPGWTRQIHRRVLARYAAWKSFRHETLDMFDAPEPDAPRRASGGAKRVKRRAYRPAEPYDKNIALGNKTMPDDGEYNHPEGLPF